MVTQRSSGFPEGYFIIRSVSNGRVLDVRGNESTDSTEIILWSETETSLVQNLRDPNFDNQIFFIDPTGVLCSKSTGHAIDVEDRGLVLRHRRPVTRPFPNEYSHPSPTFSYQPQTQEIVVNYQCDPSYPEPSSSVSASEAWKDQTYVLSAIPLARPRSIIQNASEFIQNAIVNPFGFLSAAGAPHRASLDDVVQSDIDLREEEVLEEDRAEVEEADDSPDLMRKIRVVHATDGLSENAAKRRRWEVVPLRKSRTIRTSISSL